MKRKSEVDRASFFSGGKRRRVLGAPAAKAGTQHDERPRISPLSERDREFFDPNLQRTVRNLYEEFVEASNALERQNSEALQRPVNGAADDHLGRSFLKVVPHVKLLSKEEQASLLHPFDEGLSTKHHVQMVFSANQHIDDFHRENQHVPIYQAIQLISGQDDQTVKRMALDYVAKALRSDKLDKLHRSAIARIGRERHENLGEEIAARAAQLDTIVQPKVIKRPVVEELNNPRNIKRPQRGRDDGYSV